MSATRQDGGATRSGAGSVDAVRLEAIDLATLASRAADALATGDGPALREQRVVRLLASLTRADGVAAFTRGESGLVLRSSAFAARSRLAAPVLAGELRACAHAARGSGRLEVRTSTAAPALTLLACAPGDAGIVLATAVALGGSAVEPFAVAMQLLGGALQADDVSPSPAVDADAALAGALAHADADGVAQGVLAALRAEAAADVAALGLRSRAAGGCRLRASSVGAEHARRSRVALALESMMELAARGGRVLDSAAEDAPAPLVALAADLAVRRLAVQPLPARAPTRPPARSRSVGGRAPAGTGTPSATTMALAGAVLAARGLVPRASTARLRGRGVVTATVVLLIVLGVMALPVPHAVRADARLEARLVRHVAAPFDGLLAESTVRPGDTVARGELLARMDGRDLAVQIAAVAAERAKAAKRRDVALAARAVAEGQLAGLDVERLDAELELLEHRAGSLDIASPIDGVVVRGDLARAEGAPVGTGEPLFEIAPLDRLRVDLAVRPRDIARVRTGADVVLALDAFPGREWSLALERVQPAAENRDGRHVFIAETTLPADAAELRPGMEGAARIGIGRRALGYVLFHEPWQRLREWLGP